MKKLLSILLLALMPALALAQSPSLIKPGHVWGNSTAAERNGRDETASAIFDRAFGSTRGALIERGASGWGLLAPAGTARVPYLSGGAGADPLYGPYTVPASVTSGGVACFTSTAAEASSALLTLNALVLGGGAGACPTVLGSLGTATTILHGNAGGAPSFGAVVSADMNITATNCTNQLVSAISTGGVGTCRSIASTDFSAGLQTALTGTTGKLAQGSGAIGFTTFTLAGDCTFTTPNINCTTVGGLPVTPFVTSMTALRALAPNASPVMYLAGYYSTGDAGAGYFYWNSASTATDNAGSIIQPNAGGTGRWIRIAQGPVVSFTPEMFGAQQTPGSSDDAAPIRAAVSALGVIGKGRLSLGSVTYNMCSVGTNRSAINNISNIDIIGSGASSILRFCNNLVTSNATFSNMIYPASFLIADSVSNAQYRNFIIDMNGANNSCSGTCYAFDAGLGAAFGDNIIVDGVTIFNNPGSQGFSFGAGGATFPTFSNLVISNTTQENTCKVVNAACTDYSGIQIRVINGQVTGNALFNLSAVATGIEIHGFNVTASGNTVWSAGKGIIMAADATAGAGTPNANGLVATGNSLGAISITGIDIWASAGANANGIQAANNYIALTGAIPNVAGIDAATNVSSSAGSVTRLVAIGNTITSGLAGTIANANTFPGIQFGTWSEVLIHSNIITNMGGPGVIAGGAAPGGAVVSINNNVIHDDGRVVTAGNLQSGIFSQLTGTVKTLSIQGNNLNNTSTAYMATGIIVNSNSTQGLIAGNVTAGIATAVAGTGTGNLFGQTCTAGTVTAATITTLGGIITHC